MPIEFPPQTDDLRPLPRLVGHHCFACGSENPRGLRMRFSLEGETLRAEVSLHRDFVGWSRIAHGGIVSTLLDEVMAYAVIALRRDFFVTRSMQLRYLRQVPVEAPLILRAGLQAKEEPHPRLVRTWGRVEDEEGHLLARAEAEMALISADRLPLDEPLRRDMERLFALLEES